MGANIITLTIPTLLGLLFGLVYSWNISQKVSNFFNKNHDIFFNSILISLALKICQNMSFRKKLKLLNMSFYYLNALAIMLY